MFTRTTYANVTATLALVVALGSGGAYAAGLAKNSVGSKHIKNSAIKAKDVGSGALTGAQVRDGTLTGADIDESSLSLPAAPVTAKVFQGPLTYNATLTNQFADYATITFTVPAAGFVRLEGAASLSEQPGATGLDYLDALLWVDQDPGSYATWDNGDPDGLVDNHQTITDIAAVGPGTHTAILQVRERVTNDAHSQVLNAHVDVEYFPSGSVQPPLEG